MSKKFEAESLEEVYELASKDFDCSITDLEIELIQEPKKGFFGFGKKNAIIKAYLKKHHKNYDKKAHKKSKFVKKNIKIEDVSSQIEANNKKSTKKDTRKEKKVVVPKVEGKDKIFNNFYHEENSKNQISNIVIKKDKEEIIKEITDDLHLLFDDSCYDIDSIKVEFYDEKTVYVEFNGEDSALLIGKEGYRYKALSYILFNWINDKYGLMLRLEVAQFLENQELAIHTYLDPLIEVVKEKGYLKTKPLDGILVHIALKRLREEFPDKYVAVKTNIKGDRYVLVNEYRKKED